MQAVHTALALCSCGAELETKLSLLALTAFEKKTSRLQHGLHLLDALRADVLAKCQGSDSGTTFGGLLGAKVKT